MYWFIKICLTVWEITEEVSTNIGSCHTILTENLTCISAKFMSYVTDEQKTNPLILIKNCLNVPSIDKNGLKNIMTKSLGFMVIILKPRQSLQWVWILQPKSLHISVKHASDMLMFYGWKVKSIMNSFYMVRQHSTCRGLNCEKISITCSPWWQCWLMSFPRFWNYLTKHETIILPHQPHCSDLAPTKFMLFLKLKTILTGFFSNHKWDSGNYDTQIHSIPKNIPRKYPKI